MTSFERLVAIISVLRAPGGCPWDIMQTFESLQPHIIEEAYELAQSMADGDMQNLKEELGDVLLHVVMLSNMASEKNAFNIQDVIKDVTKKMIHRHPHVFFKNDDINTAEEVEGQWDKIKAKESPQAALFDSIPKALPALTKAQKTQRRADKQGFGWDNVNGAIEKLDEEITELKAECQSKNMSAAAIEDELGDVLFSVVNVARHLDVNAEAALQNCIDKFQNRFLTMQTLMAKDNKTLSGLSLAEKEVYWDNAKQKLAVEKKG